MKQKDYIKILKQYKETSATKYGILSMGIFGSVARNDIKPDSDLDIFVKMSIPNPFYLVHIKDDIEKITHCRVDIVRFYDTMNATLKKRIEKEGLYV